MATNHICALTLDIYSTHVSPKFGPEKERHRGDVLDFIYLLLKNTEDTKHTVRVEGHLFGGTSSGGLEYLEEAARV